LRWADYACESDTPATNPQHRRTFERIYRGLVHQYQAPNDAGVATLDGDKLQTLRHSLGATQIDYALWYPERTIVSLFLIRYEQPEKLPTIWLSYKDSAYAWSSHDGAGNRVFGKLHIPAD